MARIIYKEGCEGQNKIECIEGIEIELLNGYKALVYPKYKELPLLKNTLPLLKNTKLERWKASGLTEMQAFKVIDGKALTDELLELGSPAAKFVRQFKSDRRGEFDLPTLLAAGEIVDQKIDINALAETIEGADLLRNVYLYFWSCCRHSFYYAWLAIGYHGFLFNHSLYYEASTVPTKIYK